MKKRSITYLLLLILPVTLLLSACDERTKTEREVDSDTVLAPTYNNDLEEVHEIVREHDLDDFTFVTKYDTINYDLNNWRIIDNKTLKTSAWTEGAPTDWEIIIEHVHIDLFITNKYKEYPTLLQDSMDDKYHGYQQDGFKISDYTRWENIFGIIGATPELHSALRRSGDFTLTLKSLRESDFAKNYYDSNTLQIIYDVMVKKPGEDYFETIAVYDEIIIPVGYSYESN